VKQVEKVVSSSSKLSFINQPSIDISLQLSYFHARLALLLHVAQSRLGASAVLTAGLFHSVKLSGLFAIDPELGVGRSMLISQSYQS
jgi:hypothetical protein